MVIAQTHIMESLTGVTDQDVTPVKQFYSQAVTSNQGPSPFICVTHQLGEYAKVEVIIAMRPYVRNLLMPADQDPTLVNKVYLAVGEIFTAEGMLELPSFYKEPDNIIPLMVPAQLRVPTEDALAEAFQAFDAANGDPASVCELMASGLDGTNQLIAQVLPVPVDLVPTLIEGHCPREALRRVQEVIKLVPEEKQACFAVLLNFLRLACTKTGGNRTITKELSKVRVTLATPPGRTTSFQMWQRASLQGLFPEAFPIAQDGRQPGGDPGWSIQTIRDIVNTGAQAASSEYANYKAANPDSMSSESKTLFSPMTQERIIYLCGLHPGVDWEDESIPAIWKDYVSELQKTKKNKEYAITQVFKAAFQQQHDTFEEIPRMTVAVAKHILSRKFAPDTLTLSTLREGFLPMAWFREQKEHEVSREEEEEDFRETTHRTMQLMQDRRQRKQATTAIADSFERTMGRLKTYMLAVECHFGANSELHKGIRTLYRSWSRGRDVWQAEGAWTAEVAPRFWWHLSTAIQRYLDQTPGESAEGLDVVSLAAAIKDGSIGAMKNMPSALIPAPYNARVSLPPFPTTVQSPAPPGAPPPSSFLGGRQEGTKTNPAVNPLLKSYLGPALEKLGPRTTLGKLLTLWKHVPGQTSKVEYLDLILDEQHCQEYCTAGRCINPRCSRQHIPGAALPPAKVQEFITKTKPLVEFAMSKTGPELLQLLSSRKRAN
jgi:hypothetical protein